MAADQRDRWFLPGWWRFWESGPQWSDTARQRIGVDPPQVGEHSDWRRWERELLASTRPESGTQPEPGTGTDLRIGGFTIRMSPRDHP